MKKIKLNEFEEGLVGLAALVCLSAAIWDWHKTNLQDMVLMVCISMVCIGILVLNDRRRR